MSARPDVNLFRVARKPKVEPLTGPHLVFVGLGFVVLLLVAGGFAVSERLGLQRQVEQLARVLDAETARTEAWREQYRNRDPAPELVAELAALERDLHRTAGWLALVQADSGANRSGFSRHLADLARHHVSGLWLTGIELRGGGDDVQLTGMTTEARHVPRYLSNLSRNTGFSGKEFRGFQVDARPNAESDQGRALRFRVSTSSDDMRVLAARVQQ